MMLVTSPLRLLGMTSILFAAFAALAAAADVTLETSKSCFVVSDTVFFTLTNNRDSTIYMPHDPPWAIFDDSADTLIYPSIVLPVIVSLGATSSKTYTWTQFDYHLNQVSTGTYWVEISYSQQMEPWQLITVADTFDIQDECPSTAVERSSWSAIKDLFR